MSTKLSKQQKRDLKRAAQVQAGTREAKHKKRQKHIHNHHGRGFSDSKHDVEEIAIVPLSVYKRDNPVIEPLSVGMDIDPDTILYARDRHFDQVLQHSYDKFVHEPQSTFPDTFHSTFKTALSDLNRQHVYKHDLVQPFGLGGKIAKTFVERILVGEPGITYKYLGSRMFAYPWEGTHANPAMQAIGRANMKLQHHTRSILSSRGLNDTGYAYNLTLINKCHPDKTSMTSKDEQGKRSEKNDKDKGKRGGDMLPYAVSWHADSSLDHFSSIGVLNYLVPDTVDDNSKNEKEKKKGGDWKLALRVSNHIEGPSRGEKNTFSGSDNYAPPVVVDIKDNESYFLLDNFNHHHQHAVIAGSSLRYSSTHRVSRTDGHTYDSISKKCLQALNSAISCSPKVLR